MPQPTIEELRTTLDRLNRHMSDPAVSRNATKMRELSREHGVARELLSALEVRDSLATQLAQATTLVEEDDADLRTLAQDDVRRLQAELDAQQDVINELLVPRDPRDDRNCILEIRAGAGGEEAALFASELFRAYSRYAERVGWRMHTISASHSEQGGYKEVVAEVAGKGVFGMLRFERGVHRIQRVPETEKMGRTHTSTVTVAVLPQAEEVDLSIRSEDLRIDTYRAGGAGGQHVNKTSSAVRITHLPTNTVVAVQDERSQHKNKEKAMSILRSRLLEAEEERRRSAAAGERRQQVGTGDRSEKIRTYNAPQDRITDHRIKKSWHNIPSVMEGAWDEIFTELAQADRALKLNRAGS